MTEQQIRAKVVSTMQGWVGWSEANGKHRKIIDIYNAHKPLARGYAVKYTDQWCATTVSAAAIQCGLTDIMPTECSCGRMIELYKAKGRWMENDAYGPAPGDIIMYDWQDDGKGDNTGAPDHVGIVEKVAGGIITVIEGNKGKAVSRRTIAVNGRFIRGYCLPDYTSKATKAEPVKAEQTETVKKESPAMKVEAAKNRVPSAAAGVKFSVTASTLNVRASASTAGNNVLRTVPKGTVVTWFGYYTGAFYLVQLPDRSTGYVHKNYLRRT